MTYWPWWMGGLALASVMALHWVFVRRMMGVSGRFTALVERVRSGHEDEDDGGEMDAEALVAAMREATASHFGESALGDVPVAETDPSDHSSWRGPSPDRLPALTRAQPPSAHLVFLGALVAGGLLSAVLAGRAHAVAGIAGSGFARLTHGSPVVGALVLVSGGMLVGFGTRMAGGCTSGHGMCGVSRFQTGSLLATAAFFGTGVAVSLLLGRML